MRSYWSQRWPFYGCSAFEVNRKGEKACKEVASWADKKSFWSIIFSYSIQQQQTISRSDCYMQQKVDFIWQPVMTSSVTGPRRKPKALPKAKPGPQKSHGHCSVVWCQSDPLQLSESQRNHYIWKVCSANWWDALKIATSAFGINLHKGPSSSP